MTELEHSTSVDTVYESTFAEVTELIRQAKLQTYQLVSTVLIDLYWKVGEYISAKLTTAAWGEGVVDKLARYLARTQPGIRGFSRQNLFRMKLFYETYQGDAIVSPLVRQLPWTHNLIIMGQSKSAEEREFYQASFPAPSSLRLVSCQIWYQTPTLGKRVLLRTPSGIP